MAAPTVKAPTDRFDRSGRFAVTLEQGEILDALAASMFGGNVNAAIRYLIDLHAGRVLDQVEREDQLPEPVFDVARFAKPRLTREVASYIAGSVAAGLPLEAALDLAGVTTRQRREWWRRGQSDRAEGRESLHADYVTAVLQAQAMQKQENIAAIRKHRSKVWTAAAWLLERQYPDEFGERKRLDKSVSHNVMPFIDYDKLTLAETRQLLHLLRKGQPDADERALGRNARPAAELVPHEVVEAVDGDWEEVPQLEAPTVEEAPGVEGAEAPPIEEVRDAAGGTAPRLAGPPAIESD